MSRNHAVLDEIRKFVSEGEALDMRTRDRLLLTGQVGARRGLGKTLTVDLSAVPLRFFK